MPVVVFVTVNASLVVVVTAAVVSVPAFALIEIEPFALCVTVVVLLSTIFAWYLTTFLVAGLLLSIFSVVTVAIVPSPFWKSTVPPLVTFVSL